MDCYTKEVRFWITALTRQIKAHKRTLEELREALDFARRQTYTSDNPDFGSLIQIQREIDRTKYWITICNRNYLKWNKRVF